jgi:NADH dehydrogenase (ubiquinone) 1 alpha subcomplex subunit 9
MRALSRPCRGAPGVVRRWAHSSSSVSATPPGGNSTYYAPIKRLELSRGTVSGPGGRHSRSGLQVCVLGGTGFVGGFVVSELARVGSNIVVATQGDDMGWRHLKPCADYGKLVAAYMHLKDEGSVRAAIKGADVVVNLMGRHYETKHYLPTLINCSFEDVHVRGAELVARISREEEVKHLVHMTSTQASAASQSRWARSKHAGEQAVLAQFPGAVLVRPNMCYADEDRYLTRMASMCASLPFFPLVEGGSARQSPVYVGDVGKAVAAIARDFGTAGQVFNLSGEQSYTTKEVAEYVMQQTQHGKPLVDVPLPVARLAGRLINNLPNPYLNEDQVLLQLEDAPGVRDGELGLRDLGFTKISEFEQTAYNFLFRFRRGGHFVDAKAARPSHN